MNIEKTISEQAVSDILTPMLESQDRIVTEDVAPLFEQATGLDTPPASGTVTTTIEESRSVISAIIRKAWTATLTMLGGASVIGYIAAAYTYLLTRLQGNETYGIPDRRSEISASSPLAANLALLNDRKIGGVNAEMPDGVSMGRLLCDSSMAAMVTEITDDTEGWTMDEKVAWASKYPSLKKLTLNCTSSTEDIISDNTTVEELNIRYLEAMPTRNQANQFRNLSALKKFEAPSLKTFGAGQAYILCNLAVCKSIDLPVANTTWNGLYGGYVNNCPNLEWVNMPNWPGITSIYGDGMFNNNPKLERVVWGKITSFTYPYTSAKMFDGCPNLIDLELGEGSNVSIRLANWSPTLDSSNLQQFLSNFKTYIANRLKGFPIGQGPTLTLSQAVFSAVIEGASPICDDIKGIIEDKGWKVQDTNNNIFPTT